MNMLLQPGTMYIVGSETRVQEWNAATTRPGFIELQLLRRPGAIVERERDVRMGFRYVCRMKATEFLMKEKGLLKPFQTEMECF